MTYSPRPPMTPSFLINFETSIEPPIPEDFDPDLLEPPETGEDED